MIPMPSQANHILLILFSCISDAKDEDDDGDGIPGKKTHLCINYSL